MAKTKIVLLSLVFFAFSTFSTPGQDPTGSSPLAELSRKEKERKRNVVKKAPVISNADLQKFADARVTTSQPSELPSDIEVALEAPATPTAEAQPAAASQKPLTEKDLEFWKAAFNEARLNLKNAVNLDLVLQLRINNLQNAYLREDDGATQALLQRQLQETSDQLQQNVLEIEKAKKALDILAEEARRSGLQPGVVTEMIGELPETTRILPEIPNEQ
ncbi:MAG: hypothetical protein HY645_00630 [Acidobacteria bacterium]|nr:hypothetical protein [Acidobacteriota bacterium]